jgi:CheY-like chemotaxis protein
MRKRRAIIFDDNDLLLSVFKDYFMHRGYEVLTTEAPVVCPVCDNNIVYADKSCADVIITDFNMPHMNGIERLKAQSQRGCKVPAGNKVLMLGYVDESGLWPSRSWAQFFSKNPLLSKTFPPGSTSGNP